MKGLVKLQCIIVIPTLSDLFPLSSEYFQISDVLQKVIRTGDMIFIKHFKSLRNSAAYIICRK